MKGQCRTCEMCWHVDGDRWAWTLGGGDSGPSRAPLSPQLLQTLRFAGLSCYILLPVICELPQQKAFRPGGSTSCHPRAPWGAPGLIVHLRPWGLFLQTLLLISAETSPAAEFWPSLVHLCSGLLEIPSTVKCSFRSFHLSLLEPLQTLQCIYQCFQNSVIRVPTLTIVLCLCVTYNVINVTFFFN